MILKSASEFEIKRKVGLANQCQALIVLFIYFSEISQSREISLDFEISRKIFWAKIFSEISRNFVIFPRNFTEYFADFELIFSMKFQILAKFSAKFLMKFREKFQNPEKFRGIFRIPAKFHWILKFSAKISWKMSLKFGFSLEKNEFKICEKFCEISRKISLNLEISPKNFAQFFF